MAAISFKSVGEVAASNQQLAQPDPPPIGIATPMQLGEGSDSIFKMHRNLERQIADNLRNLILTNHGERLGLYDFGANLLPISFSFSSPDWETEAMLRIKSAVGKYMPFVVLDSFEPEINNNADPALSDIAITVSYSVPTAGISNKAIKVFLKLGG